MYQLFRGLWLVFCEQSCWQLLIIIVWLSGKYKLNIVESKITCQLLTENLFKEVILGLILKATDLMNERKSSVLLSLKIKILRSDFWEWNQKLVRVPDMLLYINRFARCPVLCCVQVSARSVSQQSLGCKSKVWLDRRFGSAPRFLQKTEWCSG